MDTMTNNSQKGLIEATPILVWSSIYETGHPEIDDQHVNLVNLINKLGWYRINDTSVEQLTIACRELVEYAQYHFSFEEQLLIPSLLDEEDKTHHINSHEKFHEQALILTKTISTDINKGIDKLLSFLVKWLCMHILAEDMQLVASLLQPPVSIQPLKRSNRVLLDAVDKLYDLLADQQAQLVKFYKQQAELSEARFKMVSEYSYDAEIWMDSAGEIIWCNKAGERVIGYSFSEYRDNKNEIQHILYDQENYNYRTKLLNDALNGIEHTDEKLRLTRRDGTLCWIESNWQSLFNEQGQVCGVRISARDITKRKQQEDKLNLFRFVIDNADDAILIVDADTAEIIDVSQRACVDLGYSANELMSLCIYDINTTLTNIVQWKEHVSQATFDTSFIFRDFYRRKDKSTYPVEVSARRVCFNQKNLMVGIARDITARVHQENRESLRNEALSLLARGHKQAVILNKIVNGLEAWISNCRATIDIFDDKSQQKNPQNDIREESIKPNWSKLIINSHDKALGILSIYSAENWLPGEDELNAIDVSAQLAGIVIEKCMADEILKQREIEAYSTARTDTLTGLANRRMLFEYLPIALERMQRQQQKLALVFIDIDYFKKINDSFGHETGDLLLKAFANRLKRSIRAYDLAVRLSGDEFVILMENVADKVGFTAVEEKIKNMLHEPFIFHDNPTTISLSASIGISVYPDDATDTKQLLNRADQAMYHVKASGRGNCYRYSKD
ncbi:diguanylate cyclase domain-containing protein [uncultured Tolumonas sp.]|uniref:diguanylate cyclase domain-containing protein n=1 Tax=uncultured Tolumonas sp. TaxID=263765 RepID=UPI002A0A2318|nr:diguanylate cyclase [uncultured Tolumonas sp.]